MHIDKLHEVASSHWIPQCEKVINKCLLGRPRVPFASKLKSGKIVVDYLDPIEDKELINEKLKSARLEGKCWNFSPKRKTINGTISQI